MRDVLSRTESDSSFLANRDGTPVARRTVHDAFVELRRSAGILGTNGTRQSPRLHSFRHTFAVNRLTAWYREGADVQRLLPVLSTYLGHNNLAGTQGLPVDDAGAAATSLAASRRLYERTDQ